MADVVKDLMIVLGQDGQMPVEGAQVEAIRTAIANNLPELGVEFQVAKLCARYAQQTVPNQKKILKSLERAATFKRNRDAFLRARQQAGTVDLKVASC
jgi:hypothetical protein